MFLKTLLFVIFLYLLIRFVSKMFLTSGKGRKGNVHFFYNTFKNVRQQQKEQQQQKRRQNPEEHLDEIEEAEYEDVSDEKDEK
ncbi:MAG TPA: hypothetical protein VK106_05425 [Balneolaceae bacterium]|nr:hypothetical protein [Balneolaceae bacterium]